jgi:hypothetical protein
VWLLSCAVDLVWAGSRQALRWIGVLLQCSMAGASVRDAACILLALWQFACTGLVCSSTCKIQLHMLLVALLAVASVV